MSVTADLVVPSLPLTGLSVVVTGVLAGLSREQAQAAVGVLGGVASGSVSGKTGLVVTGVGAGVSKLAKARTHRTPVLGGDTFLELLADPSSWDGLPVGVPLGKALVLGPVPVPAWVTLHRVGKVVVFPAGVREIRLMCTYCKHAWRGSSTQVIPACPNDVRVTVGDDADG
ncbi:MAG: BRCT domain-containing protein [Propionicimonas sp.]